MPRGGLRHPSSKLQNLRVRAAVKRVRTGVVGLEVWTDNRGLGIHT